jgi:tetratricopeptide (TPR) repeat protein/tRNA A-37 threonylcarbamoyl transferase component Bud32
MTQQVALARLLLADQSAHWSKGEPVLVEGYLEKNPELQSDHEAVLDLIYNEIVLRQSAGEEPGLAEYLQRFPHLSSDLGLLFEVHGAIERGAMPGESQDLDYGQLLPEPENSVPTVPGYEILCELGRGGMGVVYKVRDSKLERLVALKVVLAGPHASTAARTRFLIEARAVARLQHPGIVQIFQVGEHEGMPFLVLEYAEGGSLDQRTADGGLPPAEAARLVEALGRAVHCAHERGILHRDLKPSNVLLTADGSPKLTDFGLAKLLDVGTGPTPTDAFLGTPSYIAPEQAAGKTREVGVGADVYSLGAILYELLTGRPPFQGQTLLSTLAQVQTEEPVPPSRLRANLSRDLESICLKCLEKSPRRRYASAAALADDLARFLDGQPVEARPISAWRRVWRSIRRRPVLLAWTFGVAALLCLALFALASVRLAEQEGQRRSAQRSARFARCRDEAIFYGLLTPDRGTLFTGPELAANLRTTEAAAREALDLAGPGTSEDCYTLVLVLAETLAQDASRPAGERYQDALCALDHAERFGFDTRAAHLRRAHFLTRLGEQEEARKESERAASLPPQSALDHFLAGEESYRRGSWAEAMTSFNRVLTVQPAHFWAQFFLAVCQLRLRQWEAARAGLTACLASRPEFVWAYLFRAFAQEKLGALSEAEDDFQKAFQLDPGEDARYTLLLTRGVLRFQQKDLERAASDFREAQALKPTQYNAFVNLAWVYLARGQLDLAAEEMKRAERLQPPPSVLLDYHSERARRLCQLGKYNEALEACAAALSAVPGHPLPQGVRARALLELRQYEQAERAYGEYLRDGGEASWEIFRGRGLARMKLGRYPEAVDDYTRALERRPDAEISQHRGWAHFFSDAWKLSLRDFNQAIELGGAEQTDACVGRGLARVMLGAYREAVADAETCLRRRPDTPEMMHNVACIFAEAAARVEADRGEPNRETLAATYRKQGLEALRLTLKLVRPEERRSFWRDRVLTDKSLVPLHGCPDFQRMQQEVFGPR